MGSPQQGKHLGCGNRHQAGHSDGKAAHGALDLSHLDGLGGTQSVGGGANGDASCHRMGDLEQAAQKGSHAVAQNAGEDDGSHRHGSDTAQLFRQAHADGGGHRFGQQGDIIGVAQPEQGTHGKDGQTRGQHARKNTHQNGGVMFFQLVQLAVQGDCQTDGGRGQQIAQGLGAGLEHFIIDAQQGQHGDDARCSQQQGIGQGTFEPLVQLHTQKIGPQAEKHAEAGAVLDHLTHFFSPFSRFKKNWVTRPVTAKVMIMPTRLMTKKGSRMARRLEN